MSEFSDGRRHRRLNCGIEPTTRGSWRGACRSDNRQQIAAAWGGDWNVGKGSPGVASLALEVGGDLCYLVNHRVVGVAYHFGCLIRGFFLVAGFYIDGVAVAVEVDYFHLVFFHAVGA